VSLVEEFGHSVAGVAVELLKALGRERHSDDAGSDIRQVKVVSALTKTLLFAGDESTKEVHIVYREAGAD
jgi:hypothetical protein